MSAPRSARVDHLRQDSAAARNLIAQAFSQNRVPVQEASACAWGQYLAVISRGTSDAPDPSQYGIYGTSAGLEVLARQNPRNPLIVQARRVLPAFGDPPGEGSDLERVQRRFADKGDLDVVYKLSALLDASLALNAQGSDVSRHYAQLLIGACQSGWSDYRGPDYQVPNAHATAVALYSLSKAPLEQDDMLVCVDALHWLVDLDFTHQSIATVSMTLIAIRTFLGRPDTADRFDGDGKVRQLLDKCETALSRWLMTTEPAEIRRSLEGTEYRLPQNAARASANRFTFLFYLPHCLAALAVLQSEKLLASSRARTFVLGVVEVVTQRINGERYFVAAGRNLASTVEHLWLHRLLYAFEHTQIYGATRQVIRDRLRESRRNRLSVVAAAILLVGLTIGADRTEGAFQIGIIAMLSVVAALAGDGIGRALGRRT